MAKKNSDRMAEARWIEDKKHWKINVQRDGDRKSFYSSIEGRKGKHEAENKADSWLESGSGKDVRFEVAKKEYLEHVKSSTGDETYIKAESILRNWFSDLDKRKVSTITTGDFQDIIDAAGKKGRAKRTCGNIRAHAISVYLFCRSKRYPLEEPVGLTLPTNAPVGKRKILQPSAVYTLFTEDKTKFRGKIVPDFYIHAYRFLFLIVLRRGELCGIRDAEDIKDGALDLKRSINRLNKETAGKNKNAQRLLVLPPMALQVIADQKAMLKRMGLISPWLFPDEHGHRMNTNMLYKSWRRYRALHGMPSNLHELRHSAISNLKADLPLALMKPRIGHSLDMDTLGTYGHEIDDDAQKTADIMETVYRRIMEQNAPENTTQNTTL